MDTGTSAQAIAQVGIVGAGRMGWGIATLCAMHGRQPLLADRDPEQLAQANVQIETWIERRQKRGQIDAERARQIQAAIQTVGGELDRLASCDLVIECVSEDESAKRDVLEACGRILPEHACLASCTSSMSITRLGAISGRGDRFMGLHFMNPPLSMRLVELVRGITTSAETEQRLEQFIASIDRIAAKSEDFPAFLVNRILLVMTNEAIWALYEGVGTIGSIDQAMRLGTHHPMGPLELADFIGLDICLSILGALSDGLADRKYRPCPLLRRYVEAGWLGRKTGRGFYDYSADPPVPTR